MSERNALAELAERLPTLKSKSSTLRVNAHDVCKTRRIIAELAKVAFFDGINIVSDIGGAVGAVERCRAIAEEGVGKFRAIAKEKEGEVNGTKH